MATDVKDIGDTIGSALGRIAREATHAVSQDGHRGGLGVGGRGDGALSGMRGVVAGAALAAAAPLAARGAGHAVKKAVAKRVGSPDASPGGLAQKAAEGAKGAAGDAVGRAVGGKIDEAGGAPGAIKEAGKKLLPFGGGDSKGEQGTQGVGKGRRMPVQQAVDVGVPLRVAYDQWTQFEDWPQFMHRVVQVTKEDDCSVSFKVKVWGMSREFVAEIQEQRPDERIEWSSKEGVSHSGVVTFHELAPRLTRVQVSLDVDPGSLVEKAARGMRHVKRAVRADLARYKAFIELEEEPTGAWRGTIRDGEVVEARDGGSSGRAERGASRRRASRSARSRSNGQHRGGRRASGRRSGGARRRRSGASRSRG
jgi:uncharacterized membrane protein